MSDYKCNALPRELTETEQATYEEFKKAYEQTGECSHVLFGLFAEGREPWHGCIVCDKPIA